MKVKGIARFAPMFQRMPLTVFFRCCHFRDRKGRHMSSRTWRRVVALGLMVALVSSCTADSVSTSPDNPNLNPIGTSPDNPNLNGPKGALLVKSDKPQDITPTASDADVKDLGTGNRAFAFALYSELAQEQGNLFFSPYSISVALAMTYAGARGNTASEMQHALHFGVDQTTLHAAFNATGQALDERQHQLPETSGGNGFELNIVNQAWGDKQTSILHDYLDVLAQNYGAGMYLVDFMHDPDGSRMLINDWVASQTKERITDLLPQDSIDSDTALVLTNAIYFKASWLFPFNPAMTQSAVFHAPAGDRSVTMMHQVLETRYTETADYQAVELPYLSPAVRMLIVLPAPGHFDAVAQRLSGTFDHIRMQLANYLVTLAMPKFSFDGRLSDPS